MLIRDRYRIGSGQQTW